MSTEWTGPREFLAEGTAWAEARGLGIRGSLCSAGAKTPVGDGPSGRRGGPGRLTSTAPPVPQVLRKHPQGSGPRRLDPRWCPAPEDRRLRPQPACHPHGGHPQPLRESEASAPPCGKVACPPPGSVLGWFQACPQPLSSLPPSICLSFREPHFFSPARSLLLLPKGAPACLSPALHPLLLLPSCMQGGGGWGRHKAE